MRAVFAALALLIFAAPAHASVLWNGVTLDPENHIRPALLQQAVQALETHANARRDRLVVVDFTLPSARDRFFVVNLTSGAVQGYVTAHGSGSDPAYDGYAHAFSNADNTHASSLGAYLTGEPYNGGHGYSLRLDGLDASNANARERAIVIHTAPYVDPQWLAANGKAGRSWGCFVLPSASLHAIIADIEGGVLLYAGA